MKIIVSNRSANSVSSGYDTVPPGTTKVYTGRSLAQTAAWLKVASALVEVQTNPDVVDNPVWQTVMQTPANPGGGVRTLAGEGFTVQANGSAISSAEPVGLGVFDDAACTIPSATGTISTATDGTITSGSGTNAIQATVNPANGKLTVSVNVTKAQSIWVKPLTNPNATHILDCSPVRQTTFT